MFQLLCLVSAVLLILPFQSYSQEKKTMPDGTDGTELTIPRVDSITGKSTNLQPNEVNAKFTTFRIGMGYIGDYVTYSQSSTFKQQMDSANLDVQPKFLTRDFRVLGSGKFNTKRDLSFKFGIMYDGSLNEWLLRESGLTIGVPELFGHIFIGRTKEGYSMIKVMNGHSPWTAERQMALDAIPILADGIKYFGHLPKSTLFWNLGYYNDLFSKGQGFSTYAWQYDARVGFLPTYNKETNRVLHVAINYRYGQPVDGKITLKSRPESNPTPQIINTGSFAADHSIHVGGELYYSTGKLLLGSEVTTHKYYSPEGGDHQFFGGDAVITYLFTGGERPYRQDAALMGFVNVKNPVFKGGWGAWEGVLRFSTLSLDDGNIHGGKFWRITPMVNWYMTKILRTEFIYGYGVLDRFNLSGAVQFYQVRFQVTMM